MNSGLDANGFRDRIDPVPDDSARPFWSVMIPTFNCARYLGETLESVLAQDPGSEMMQIEVIDDASDKDDPAAVVREVGKGRVGYYRQRKNVGHIANFYTAIKRSKGHIVHLLHGDDLVERGFYAALGRPFEQDPSIGAAFSGSTYINGQSVAIGTTELEPDRAGLLIDSLAWLASEQRIMTPSIVVRRAAYETLGGFDRRLKCAEDWEMWVRIAANYPIWYEPRLLANYRMHEGSNTGRHICSAEDLSYTRMAMDIFSEYIPDRSRAPILAQARRAYARSGLDLASQLARVGEGAGARAQIAEALRLHVSPKFLLRAGKLLLKSIAANGGRS